MLDDKVLDQLSDDTAAVSARIRRRLLAAGAPFKANDNIASYLEPGEQELLVEEVARRMEAVLDSLVIDTKHDHNTRATARRVVNAPETA